MHRKTVLYGAVRAIWSLVRYAGALQAYIQISLFISRPRMKLVWCWVFTLNCLLQTAPSDVFRSVPH